MSHSTFDDAQAFKQATGSRQQVQVRRAVRCGAVTKDAAVPGFAGLPASPAR
ncbi:hypothetical protein [Rhodoferax sp. PAMC 29310]|uniref:hypothetical protein n=1 Tax=Rhodoferax sp. PAMC 29310 TaxID=2822760 RepID=UPI001B33E503|nr:hypothetical protein [Rhodoferax sp. PAMC 29310]